MDETLLRFSTFLHKDLARPGVGACIMFPVNGFRCLRKGLALLVLGACITLPAKGFRRPASTAFKFGCQRGGVETRFIHRMSANGYSQRSSARSATCPLDSRHDRRDLLVGAILLITMQGAKPAQAEGGSDDAPVEGDCAGYSSSITKTPGPWTLNPKLSARTHFPLNPLIGRLLITREAREEGRMRARAVREPGEES